MHSPRTTQPHHYFPFLRGVSHNFAIQAIRALGYFPVSVPADDPDNPSNRPFNNYHKVLMSVHSYYAAHE